MGKFEQSMGSEQDLKLTVSDDASIILERELQQEACRGICQDIIMGQLGCDGSDGQNDFAMSPPKRWPLVVVDRESHSSQKPTPPTEKRSRKRRGKARNDTPAPLVTVDSVDLVFVDQDENSCIFAIEVCSSPSDKISDLHALQRATP